MKWIVHLRDGISADVVSDEVICEGTARFVNVSQVPASAILRSWYSPLAPGNGSKPPLPVRAARSATPATARNSIRG